MRDAPRRAGALALRRLQRAAKRRRPTRGTAKPARRASGKNKITIAMIAKSSTNPVFLAARTGAEAAAKELSEKNGIQVDGRRGSRRRRKTARCRRSAFSRR